MLCEKRFLELWKRMYVSKNCDNDMSCMEYIIEHTEQNNAYFSKFTLM